MLFHRLFAARNPGEIAFMNFARTHKCSDFCVLLGLDKEVGR